MPANFGTRTWISKSNTVSPLMMPGKSDATTAMSTKRATTSATMYHIKDLIPSLSTFNLPPSDDGEHGRGEWADGHAKTLVARPLEGMISNTTVTTATATPTVTATLAKDTAMAPSSSTTTATDAVSSMPLPPPFFYSPPTHGSDQWDLSPQPQQQEHHGGTSGNEQHAIQPVKYLVERLEAWQTLIKCVYEHLDALVTAETSIAKAYHKIDGMLDFQLEGHHPHREENNESDEKHELDKTMAPTTPTTTTTTVLPMPGSFSDTPSTAAATFSASVRRSSVVNTHHGTHSTATHTKNQKKKQQMQLSALVHAHFPKHGNIRRWCDAWQLYHTKRARDHADLAQFIRTQALPMFANIKHQIKALLRSVRADDRLSLAHLAKLRAEAAKRITRLDQQIAFFEQHAEHGRNKQDPWLTNTRVVKQMIKVYRQENKMHEAIVRLQREMQALEKYIMDEVQRFCRQLHVVKDTSWLGPDRAMDDLIRVMDAMVVDRDWKWFEDKYKDELISERAAYRHPDKLHYPHHQHALLQPIFAARMERKSSVLHQWHEHLYVLTSAGFLHEYRNQKSYPSNPTVTYFIPDYCVSTVVTNLHHDLVFQLQPYAVPAAFPRLESLQSVSEAPGNHAIRQGSKKRVIVLRAKCGQDMHTWLEHLTALSHRHRPMAHYNNPPWMLHDDASSQQHTLTSNTLVHNDETHTNMPSPRWWAASSSALASPAPEHPIATPIVDDGVIDQPPYASASPPAAETWSNFLSFAAKQLSANDDPKPASSMDPPTLTGVQYTSPLN